VCLVRPCRGLTPPETVKVATDTAPVGPPLNVTLGLYLIIDTRIADAVQHAFGEDGGIILVSFAADRRLAVDQVVEALRM
jgi:hypothetical protein